MWIGLCVETFMCESKAQSKLRNEREGNVWERSSGKRRARLCVCMCVCVRICPLTKTLELARFTGFICLLSTACTFAPSSNSTCACARVRKRQRVRERESARERECEREKERAREREREREKERECVHVCVCFLCMYVGREYELLEITLARTHEPTNNHTPTHCSSTCTQPVSSRFTAHDSSQATTHHEFRYVETRRILVFVVIMLET